MAGLTHFAATDDRVAISNHIRDHGYAIVDAVVSDDVMDAIAAEVAPYVEASRHGADEYDGTFTRRTGALIARSPSTRPLIVHPVITGVLDAFFTHVTAYQLHLTQLITIEPGETAQKLHRDQMAFDYYPFPPEYHAQCNLMWALTDFTIENGGTHVIADSSAMPDHAPFDPADSRQVEMTRGSVLFYDGKVMHGGGGNTSDGPRQGINITYSVGWVRQEENQYLSCPLDIARTLDDDLLRMMGYQQGAFAMGYVGDLVDPLAHLRGEFAPVKTIGEIAAPSADHDKFVSELGLRDQT